MIHNIFVCGTDQAAGSSVVTLGLCACVRSSVSHPAFFKPVGGGEADEDVAVMRASYDMLHDPADMCPFTVEEARELISQQREKELLRRISASYARICEGAGFVILEGINNQRSMSAFDMDINVDIAAHLGVPVLLVARGTQAGSTTQVDQLVASQLTAKRAFEEKDVEVVGVVVNRVGDADFEEIRARITGAFKEAGLALYGVMPAIPYLAFPKLDQIAEELGAEILADKDGLDTVAAHTIVAAMEPRHFLKHLNRDQTLVVTPGDREAILLALACAHKSAKRHSLAGIVLTGGLRPDPEIIRLVDDLMVPTLPIMSVTSDTFTTANRISALEVRVRPQDRDKVSAASYSVATDVQHERLWEALKVPRPVRRQRGSERFLDEIISRAHAGGKRIVLPEGGEPRTLRAVGNLLEKNVCPVTLLGDVDEIHAGSKEIGVRLDGQIDIVNPATSTELDRYAETVVELRKGKRGGMTLDVARTWLLESPIHFGVLMVQHGDAHGLVSGAVHSTADTIRPALQIIRVKPDAGVASSVFFMALKDQVLVYGDCAIIPDPNATELAAIAMSSAATARAFGIEPRVAMLSYSTGRSGAGDSVNKVTEATQIVRATNPDFLIDGPLQYDAAIDPAVGKLKQPDSPVAGQANVFVFPDLDAGNIAYKAVQRSASALAIGPVMQGLNRPVNDLSRGCTVDDIVYTVAVTAVQATAP